jgi:ATP-dependent protease ClpP protease subunit
MAKVVALQNLPEVKLLEDITRETAQRVIQELSAFKGSKVALSIFSTGGDVLASKAIGSYISNAANGLTVEARVYGNAFSGALIICAHCQSAYIAAGSFALGHEAYASDADGNKIPDDNLTSDVRSTLEAMNADQVELFAKRTKKKKDTIERWMKEDRHMSAEDATEFGLFDGIIPQATRLAAWKNTNSTPMAEDKKTVTFKVSAADALKAIASGEIHVPAEQVQSADADKVMALEKEKTDLQAKLTEVEAKLKDAEGAKTTLETEKAAEVTAKTDLQAKFDAQAKEFGELKGVVDKMTRNPLVAQVLADGKTVVIPGAPADEKGSQPATAGEQRFASAADAYEKFKQQRAAALKA